MKGQFKKLFFILLFIPIFINARVNYEDSVSFVNNYIYGFDDYRDYIYLSDRIPYSLEETGNKQNPDFKSGGFLSRREYEISNVDGNTYLSNGLQYWTLTKSSYLKHYIIDYKLAEQFDQNLSGVRVTEYIIPTATLSGTGSYGDPWEFKEMYSIHINSNLESTGTISADSSCANGKGSIHLSLTDDDSRTISICPATGYRILTNSCEKYIVPISGSGTQHIVRGLDKDNIICKITFAYITKGITLAACNVKDANNTVHACSPSKASPDKFYVNTHTGFFFKDEDAQYKFGSNEKLTNLPSLTGYTFGGYETSGGTLVVTADGTLQNGKSVSGSVELVPKMTPIKSTVTFNANGGTNLSKSSYEVTYNQKYSANGGLATVKRAGYQFLGWYTAASGGTIINDSDLVKITSNKTYYAQWGICPAGTRSDGVSCTNCAAGYYSTQGSSTCTACPAGTYSGTRAGSCTPCPAGQFNTGTANKKCNKCVAGTYNNTQGSTSCTACKAGTYNTTDGSTSCANCAAGQFNTGAGNTSCQKCGAGTYSAAGSSTCTQCNAGYYSSAGASSCTACAAGTYNTTKGQSTCSKCPAGTYNNAKGSTSCTNCAAGTYNNAQGSTSCSKCPAGKYSSGTGNTQCLSCVAGTYSSEGASTCTQCDAGKYSGAGASSCTQCAAGKYNGSKGQASCTDCPAGKYSSSAGSTSCTNCPAGKYTSTTGKTSCDNCPAGKYNTGTGNTSCTTCPAGQYNTGTGNTSCKQCEAGYYCTGGPNRQQCQSGYTSNAGSDAASDCYVAYKCSTGQLQNNATYGWICTYGPSYGVVDSEYDDCADWGVVDSYYDSCASEGLTGAYSNVSCNGSCSTAVGGRCVWCNWGDGTLCSCPKWGCIGEWVDVEGCIGEWVDVEGYYCPDYHLSGSDSNMTCFSYATQ